MSTWDDIWLNESFATWVATKVASEVRPEFEFEAGLVAAGIRAMSNDSFVSARRIREPIVDASDTYGVFDSITYSKGGAVLTMFESFLGQDVFREGIQSYLAKFAYRSVDSDDFISMMELTSGVDGLAASLRSFLDQPGVPLLDVEVQCVDQEASLRVEQRRYLPVGSEGDVDQIWSIPFCFRADSGVDAGRGGAARKRAYSCHRPADCRAWPLALG